jgi:integrase
MRKGEILPRTWSDVRVDDEYPFIYTAKTKNKRPKRLPLPKLAVVALKLMPSYQTSEYLFPAKPNVRFKGNFSKPYAWDLGKRFRRIRDLAEIKDLRIHDLRHFATTALFMEGVPDSIIAKMTGHASRVMERYKHLSPSFKQQSVELIAGQLGKRLSRRISQGTKKGTTPKKAKPAAKRRVKPPVTTGFSGGADGTRTRDLRRDRTKIEAEKVR